jgi:hypothetical protein
MQATPNSCAISLHATETGNSECPHWALSLRSLALANGAVRRRPKRLKLPAHAFRTIPVPLGNGELTLLGDPLKRFRRALDPVLAIVAFGRKLPDDLIGTAGGRTRDIARCKVHRRSNRVFVLQRPLHHAKSPRPRLWSRCAAGWEPAPAYSMTRDKLASDIRTWQMREFRWLFSTLAHLLVPVQFAPEGGILGFRPYAEACRWGSPGRLPAAAGAPALQKSDRPECCTWQQAGERCRCRAPA